MGERMGVSTVNPALQLTKMLRIKLVAENPSSVPPTYQSVLASVHAVAPLKALEDFLKPKIGGFDPPGDLSANSAPPQSRDLTSNSESEGDGMLLANETLSSEEEQITSESAMNFGLEGVLPEKTEKELFDDDRGDGEVDMNNDTVSCTFLVGTTIY